MGGPLEGAFGAVSAAVGAGLSSRVRESCNSSAMREAMCSGWPVAARLWELTKISSAVTDAVFLSGSAAAVAMLSSDFAVVMTLVPGSRKGFRETGRSGAVKGEAGL